MADNIATLVRMANQIADFFKPYPQAEAVAGVREHVTSFWTPQMRKDLEAYVAAGGEGLRPAVVGAFAPEAGHTTSRAATGTGPHSLR